MNSARTVSRVATVKVKDLGPRGGDSSTDSHDDAGSRVSNDSKRGSNDSVKSHDSKQSNGSKGSKSDKINVSANKDPDHVVVKSMRVVVTKKQDTMDETIDITQIQKLANATISSEDPYTESEELSEPGLNANDQEDEDGDNIESDETMGASLEEICTIENIFPVMKGFVESSDSDTLKKRVNSVLEIVPDMSDPESVKDYKLLLILKTFKQIKYIEKHGYRYTEKVDGYEHHNRLYKTDPGLAEEIHTLVTSTDSLSITQMLGLLQGALTRNKMRNELMTFELLHYIPKQKVRFDKDSFREVSNKICTELNRFVRLFESYLEDHSWSINFDNTMNFAVPKNKVLFSNTINSNNTDNNFLRTHLAMLVNYLRKCFNTSSIKYVIEEDTKYKFSWVLVSVGILKGNTKN